MNANVGEQDRLVRIIAGCAIIVAGLYDQSYWGLLGLVFLAAGVFCTPTAPGVGLTF